MATQNACQTITMTGFDPTISHIPPLRIADWPQGRGNLPALSASVDSLRSQSLAEPWRALEVQRPAAKAVEGQLRPKEALPWLCLGRCKRDAKKDAKGCTHVHIHAYRHIQIHRCMCISRQRWIHVFPRAGASHVGMEGFGILDESTPHPLLPINVESRAGASRFGFLGLART